jgi:hypothetical protein
LSEEKSFYEFSLRENEQTKNEKRIMENEKWKIKKKKL